MIIIPTTLSVCFGIENLKNKALVQQYKSAQNSTVLPKVQVIDGVSSENAITYYSYDYQKNYKDLYAQRQNFGKKQSQKKVVYLTFDDGPSANTEKVLDILKENDIKATFFVTKSSAPNSEALYKRIVSEGHTIGIHTYTHNYTEIYKSVDSFLQDYSQLYNYIYEITGVKPQIFRFPGGSINAYNQNIYAQISGEMLRRGFVYYDWNVSSGDAGANTTSSDILLNVVSGVEKHKKSIVLMHDSAAKAATVAALPQIISQLKDICEFKALNGTVEPIVFTYID